MKPCLTGGFCAFLHRWNAVFSVETIETVSGSDHDGRAEQEEKQMSLEKLRKQSPSAILRLLLTAFTIAFAIGAVCAPDRSEMLSGLWRILNKPSLLT